MWSEGAPVKGGLSPEVVDGACHRRGAKSVIDIHHRDAAGEVDIAAPLDVPHPDAFGPLDQSLKIINSDPAVVQAFGTPITPGLFVTGEMSGDSLTVNTIDLAD